MNVLPARYNEPRGEPKGLHPEQIHTLGMAFTEGIVYAFHPAHTRASASLCYYSDRITSGNHSLCTAYHTAEGQIDTTSTILCKRFVSSDHFSKDVQSDELL